MKRLKNIAVLAFEDYSKVLSEWEMLSVVAGNGEPTWDCMFNMLIYIHQQKFGFTLDKDQLVERYTSITGHDPKGSGGANIGSFMTFMGYYGFKGVQNTTGWNSFSIDQWAALNLDNSGILHFVQPTNVGQDSDGNLHITFYDPTTGNTRTEPYSTLQGLFNMVPTYIDAPISIPDPFDDPFGSPETPSYYA